MSPKDSHRWRTLFKRRDPDRFERFNIVIAILLAGWVPSILMLVVSYTILTNTLESKILRDRQTFVQLIAHLVGDDLSRTAGIIEYYQTQPDVAKILTSPDPSTAAQQWLNQTFYSHPRVDGMFIASANGTLIASIPWMPPEVAAEFSVESWREAANASATDLRLTRPSASSRPAHGSRHRWLSPDAGRHARRLSWRFGSGRDGWGGAFRPSSSRTSPFVRSSIKTARRFSRTASPRTLLRSRPKLRRLVQEIRQEKTGHLDRYENLYSFSPIETTGWVTVVEQPKAAAYRPVRDLLAKITFPAAWLILLTAVGAWLVGKFTRRQREAARRIEREVIFNEKILANMPSGIALVDPASRNFLQANETFASMAKNFGGLEQMRDVYDATYDEVKIAPADAIDRVLAFGAPFQLVEQPFMDRAGVTHFVNVNLLRLHGSEQRIQGVLYLVEDKNARRDAASGVDRGQRGQGPIPGPPFT